MASSKCPSCGNYTFELKENEPRNSNYKMFFIQCTSCGSVISATDYYSAGVLLKEQEEKINRIENALNVLISLNESLLRK
ncbi:MAG: hypothetical protein A2499_15800 [Stygiobacter sp. RIFOXYC12_FULL_38_8]|nr:MAG: hypothetical protein A2X62_06795 [Stygiobacter sp. GWC2_38_9]OGU78348.1 MAG: hypothetical protein A2279_05970 [Stygiobacter sp. RIFOXYA12_FULL_38_9]OGV06274.1 MAG: hypothetical protein A2299_12645 [Stygiobacter sp. RIFOXYB2_FULL_37_11]OGV16025.1 MAG: hypothetical protein A2440_03575 [Stygiobacter sp. RIFOXYC2_FULL_38_25]OGV17959.1 MAG: hypothetical protein A2237_07995 [Stygiobacter sp. RIFOXYA2_FULL_38_8]OGV23780.1 MAG: hypothetical protein A2499_15800 [Stygiobacter sp. RIFOXYC12_FULL_